MLCRLKGRPAAILLKASCAFLAAVVEQLHADIFPDCMGSVEAYGIYCLDLHDPVAVATRHPQNMPRNFRQALLLDGNAGTDLPARIPDDGVPICFG
jgi:hypothetical protein